MLRKSWMARWYDKPCRTILLLLRNWCSLNKELRWYRIHPLVNCPNGSANKWRHDYHRDEDNGCGHHFSKGAEVNLAWKCHSYLRIKEPPRLIMPIKQCHFSSLWVPFGASAHKNNNCSEWPAVLKPFGSLSKFCGSMKVSYLLSWTTKIKRPLNCPHLMSCNMTERLVQFQKYRKYNMQ